eukprot:13909526-Alexandrium_andersonii.AAC.1
MGAAQPPSEPGLLDPPDVPTVPAGQPPRTGEGSPGCAARRPRRAWSLPKLPRGGRLRNRQRQETGDKRQE